MKKIRFLLPVLFAYKYLFSANLPRPLRIMAVITVGGLALGTALLLLVLSVFNGFFFLIRDHYKAFDADLKISPRQGRYILNPQRIEALLRTSQDVTAWSAVLEQQAIVRYAEGQHIAIIKGVDSTYEQVTGIKNLIQNGAYSLKTQEGEYTLVLGAGVAWRLGVNLADWINPIEVFTLSDRIGDSFLTDPENLVYRQYFLPAAVFSIEKDYDSRYVICDIGAARNLFRSPGAVTAFELKLRDESAANQVKQLLQKTLGQEVQIKTWYEQHATLNAVLQNEKAIGYLIIAFMLLLISFNIVGTLTLLIFSKQRQTAILLAIGATPSLIQRIFLGVGGLMGFLSVSLGLTIGGLLCWLQDQFGWVRFDVADAQSMLIDHFPVAVEASDLLLIGLTVMILSIGAAWLPARRAATRTIIQLLGRY